MRPLAGKKRSTRRADDASCEALAGLTRQRSETLLSARSHGRWLRNAYRAPLSLRCVPRRSHCAGLACGRFRIMLDCWQAASMVWLPLLPTLVGLSVLDDANNDPSRASQVFRLDLMQLTALIALAGSGCATGRMPNLHVSWAVLRRVFCTRMRLMIAACWIHRDGRSWHACCCDRHGTV